MADLSVRRAIAVLGMSMALATTAACSTSFERPSVASTPERTIAPFSGPSGLELESEEAARAAVAEQQRLAAQAEAARIAAEAAAAVESEEAATDDYVYDDLEVRCSDGTATVEECFGPGSDLNGNGIADINE